MTDQLERKFNRLIDPLAHTFVSATFLVISSTPESSLSPLSFFAAAAKLSVDRTLGARLRCDDGMG